MPEPFPYLAIAAALRSQDVLDVATLSAMRVCADVAKAEGDVVTGETATLTDTQKAQRLAVSLKVIRKQIDASTLALGLLQVPQCAQAVLKSPTNPAYALQQLDLYTAWLTYFTDYAAFISPS